MLHREAGIDKARLYPRHGEQRRVEPCQSRNENSSFASLKYHEAAQYRLCMPISGFSGYPCRGFFGQTFVAVPFALSVDARSRLPTLSRRRCDARRRPSRLTAGGDLRNERHMRPWIFSSPFHDSVHMHCSLAFRLSFFKAVASVSQ